MFEKIRGLKARNGESVSLFSVLLTLGQRLLAVSLHRCFVQMQGTCVCRSLRTHCCLFHGTPPLGEVARCCFSRRLFCSICFFHGRGVQLVERWTLLLPRGCSSRGRRRGRACRVPLPGCCSLPEAGGGGGVGESAEGTGAGSSVLPGSSRTSNQDTAALLTSDSAVNGGRGRDKQF